MERFLLQLMISKGIGDVTLKKILHHTIANPESTLKAICETPEHFSPIFGFKPATIESIHNNKYKAEQLAQELVQRKIVVIPETNANYPKQLLATLAEQCPPVLFAQGNLHLLSTPSVGFCGSRKVSPKGLSITEQCAQQLVHKGITVVSGYAAGTDLAAHTSAMQNGGNTIFVLAEGILKYSKKQSVQGSLTTDNHLYISQFIPDALWNAGNAMKRNAVIIGLTKAMILVESGNSGGTFAAGEETLRRNLPLFVIDYAQPEVSAEANPYFISRGGNPIRGCKGIPVLDLVFSAITRTPTIPHSYEQLSINLNT